MNGGIKSKDMQEYNEKAYEKWDTESLVPCPHCARTFLPDRLQIHLKSCKADRILKPRVGAKPASEEIPVKHHE